jgi:uncharacterized membrane protein YkgB
LGRIKSDILTGFPTAISLQKEEQIMRIRENSIYITLETLFHQVDKQITRWMARNSLNVLRMGLGVIFVWFGALKLFPGLSPAEELVRNTIYFFNPDFFLPILAVWEILIGLGFISGFITNKFQRLTILLLFLQMPGTALPLVLLPEVCWTSFPFGLTLEGQYIIKNLAIIGSALVLGATVRGGKLSAEPELT